MPSDTIISNFATSALFFSSQYGTEQASSYNMCNLVGRPTRYPSYGDFTEAAVLRTYGLWWTMAPSAPQKIGSVPSDFNSVDFVDLLYPEMVLPTEIDVYETFNPGTVVRILAWVYDSTIVRKGENINYRWQVLWKGAPERINHEARVFNVKVKDGRFPTRLIRLEFNSKQCAYYTEFDAVCLHGKRGACTGEDPPSIQSLHMKMNKLSLADVNRPVPLQRAPSLMSVPSRDEKENSGSFSMLPNELVITLLSYLSLEELVVMSTTCRYFQLMCYDPMWYREIDLQPYWHKLDDESLEHLIPRCQRLERINLSWIGHCRLGGGYLIKPDTLIKFVRECCKNVTCLRLGSCDIVIPELLNNLPVYSPSLTELDLSSCMFTTECLKALARLENLRRLNLYRVQVVDSVLLYVFNGCKKLEHFNNGSNKKLLFGDDVIACIAKNCKKLISLDLWRWKTITGAGIVTLVRECKDLEELDLGWCGNLKSREDSIKKLAESCPKLKKLFLTAVRSINNNDVLALAQHCPLLEQFDILGTSKVSPISIERLVESCKQLKMLDLSFCSQIRDVDVRKWRQRFPNLEIQKSFTDSSE